MHWDPNAVLDMPTEMRRWFVKRLIAQKEFEEQEVQAAKNKP